RRMSHGHLRGGTFVARSRLFEGRFGRLFRWLPAASFQQQELKNLGEAMTAEPEFPDDADAHDEEESQIAAGYTYLGQFIDHDLTFDPGSRLDRDNDPDSLVEFRTPRFDLDCLYGRGPDDQPYLYAEDGLRMLLGDPIRGNDEDPYAK